MRFRRSIKIAKGVRVNIGKKGITSLSVGGKGATINTSSKGVRLTSSIPGTGISHSEMIYKHDGRNDSFRSTSGTSREVSVMLGIGIFFLPHVFAWFTLRRGHSVSSRFISFGWLLFLIFHKVT